MQVKLGIAINVKVPTVKRALPRDLVTLMDYLTLAHYQTGHCEKIFYADHDWHKLPCRFRVSHITKFFGGQDQEHRQVKMSSLGAFCLFHCFSGLRQFLRDIDSRELQWA